MNLPIKQKQNHGHREQLLVAKRDEAGEGWSGRSGLADRVSIYRMDKQQGPTIYTEDYIQPPVINHNGNNRKKNVHVCTPDSLCCTVVINNGEGNGTPLQYSCLENPMDGRAW